MHNFKYLDDLIHNGAKVIVLASDIVLGADEESEYLEGIKLDVNNLVIDGNGHAIDACEKTRIFHVTGNDVTIKNITLKNGFAQDSGGAISNIGELTILDSILINNMANGDGGALHNKRRLTIKDSIFNKNTADGPYGGGGAIDNDEGEVSIIDTTLTQNTSESGGGGAIHNNGRMTIEESRLNNNSANGIFGGGGAINHRGTLTITNSTLNNNVANDDGGAIDNRGTLIITDSTLIENRANLGGALCNNDARLILCESKIIKNRAFVGGAVYNNNSKVDINDSTLKQNTAKCSGAICNNCATLTVSESKIIGNSADVRGIMNNKEGNFKIFNCEILNNASPKFLIQNNDSLQVYDSNFSENRSERLMSNDGSESNLTISNVKFIGNAVGESLVSNTGKSFSIERCGFENNLSGTNSKNIINQSELTLINPKIKDEGKSILNEGHILIKKSSKDFLSKIAGEGTVEPGIVIPDGEKFDFGYLDGKIHQSKSKEIILDEDIRFENYERDFYEGGIVLDIDDLTIDGAGKTIDGANRSRIFLITGKNITLKNIIFKNGHSHKNHDNPLNNNGGAIKNNKDIKLTVINCKFINNESEDKGGVIDNRGILMLNDSRFKENTAKLGGAIHNWGASIITESKFNENSAKSGGAIHNEGELTIMGSRLNGNASVGENFGGGAIYNSDGELHIYDSTLYNNVAEWEGGGINNNDSRLTIEKSKLKNNNAWKGGSVFNTGDLIITDSRLLNNKANFFGGAIRNAGRLSITNSTFNENMTKEGYGGAINNWDATLEIVESRLNRNVSKKGHGGAIYNNDGELILIKSTFNNNVANRGGGAIYSNNSSYKLKNCIVENNLPDDIFEHE